MAGMPRWFRRQQPPRVPHPDPQVEQMLQRVSRLRDAIIRQSLLADEYLRQMGAARQQQDSASRDLRLRGRADDFTACMQWQQQRISDAEAGLRAVEKQLPVLQAELLKLTVRLPDRDLAYLP